MAYLVREASAKHGSFPTRVLGVDVNSDFLAKASKGHYSEWSLRDTPEEARRRAFRKEGRDFVLARAIRETVTFAELNLAAENADFWQSESFDVIFCRNLLIYFSPEATRRLIACLTKALVSGGFLFLGPSETLRGMSQDFHLRHTHETFYYQKRFIPERRLSRESLGSDSVSPVAAPAASGSAACGSWIESIRNASDRIETLAHKNRQELATFNSRQAPADTSSLDRARAFMKEENFSRAMEALDLLPEQTVADPDAQILRAVLLINRGQASEAETLCNRILSLDELNAGAHYLKALSREHRGDRPGAIEHDQMAIYLDARFAMPHMHLALLSKRLGDRATARKELILALSLFGQEDPSRILLFGGGFSREALIRLCETERLSCDPDAGGIAR